MLVGTVDVLMIYSGGLKGLFLNSEELKKRTLDESSDLLLNIFDLYIHQMKNIRVNRQIGTGSTTQALL